MKIVIRLLYNGYTVVILWLYVVPSYSTFIYLYLSLSTFIYLYPPCSPLIIQIFRFDIKILVHCEKGGNPTERNPQKEYDKK